MPIDPTTGPSDDPPEAAPPFWERPETVAWFAARPPDERVAEAFPGGSRRARVLDLGHVDDGTFDAVIAIGILPGVDSDARWHATVGEIARVSRPGGTLLLTHFMPPDGDDGTTATPLPGEPHRYADPETGRAMLLLRRDELEAAPARHGFEPLHPTQVARATTMRGHRPVLNGHVRRAHAVPAARTSEETP